jgi:hypothetical protein
MVTANVGKASALESMFTGAITCMLSSELVPCMLSSELVYLTSCDSLRVRVSIGSRAAIALQSQRTCKQ